MHAPHTATARLPAALSPFIGRDRELAELGELLGDARLVTVTGAGGSGKTRLALEVARRAAADGQRSVGWVELAALGRGDLLVAHVAAQLQVHEAPDRPIIESLVDALLPGGYLLVLDNCEHLVEACAELATLLLQRCEGLRVLATSREALGIEGERAWLLRGLAVDASPTDAAGRAPQSEAMRLFADRARAVSKSFQLTAANAAAVAQICRRLDGLPLAIELAAARVTVLTPEEIAARLDQVFRLLTTGSRTALPRHRTLRAAVEWSYQLIPPAEQLLLERLAVFAGTFSLDAAERVCQGDGLEGHEVLDLLASLVGRSLVTMQEEGGSARYRLLEIVRQFAWERLGGRPDAPHALRRRHAEYFAALAEQALPHLEAEHSATWAGILTAERDNIGAALQWAFGDGDPHLGHRLVGSLWWYWGQTGQWSDWGFWQVEAMRSEPPVESPAWGQALNGVATFTYLVGDVERARPLLERTGAVLERSGDRLHLAIAMSTLGHLLSSVGDLQSAVEVGEAAAAIARTLPEPWPLCHVMSNALGHAWLLLGELDRVDACLQEAHELAERSGGHAWGLSQVAVARATLAMKRGRLAEARQQFRVAIATARAIRDPHHGMRLLLRAVQLLIDLEDTAGAARVCGAVETAREAGMLVLADEARQHDETVASLQASLGEAAYTREAEQGRPTSLWDALARVDEVLGAAGAVPVSPSRIEQPVPREPGPGMTVHALGGLQVQVGGAIPTSDVWRQGKPGELLVYLLCHPEGRTREQIGLAFWPDASSTQVRNSFHVLMHRLRKGLGRSEAVVVVGERYRIDPDVGTWFDAVEFEREVTAALRGGDHAAGRLDAALALYRGDFLEGQTVGDWSLEFHDRLRRLYVDGLSALADAHIAREDYAAAIERLEQLIRKEDLREDAYRRLMECLARVGRREQALLHYRRLVELLRQELGAVPDAETRALGKRLTGAPAAGE